MDGLTRDDGQRTAVGALAWLRVAGVLAAALVVALGPGAGAAVAAVLGLAAAYAAALVWRSLRGLRLPPALAIALADATFIVALVALTGGALSHVRLALVIHPIAMAFAHGGREIALVGVLSAAGFAAVSLTSVEDPGGATAFAETLVAMGVVGAIGVALANAFGRRTRQIEELGTARAALLHDALDAEERERARIGERLHDDTLQLLLAAQQDVREARAGYLGSLEFADEAMTDAVRALRDTVLGLHPAALDERGLEPALRVELDRVARRARLAVDLSVDPDAGGPHDALLFAAARELIANAAKHAAAGRLSVAVAREHDAVTLTVEDDGAGMRAERAAQALAEGHVGLASTRQRLEAAGGRLDVRSTPDRGTRVRATVPVRPPGRRIAAGAGDDPARLQALRATGLLDSAPEEPFDRVVRLAARLLGAPIATIGLVDAERVFLKAQVGVPEPFATRREWPLTHSPCRFAVAAGAALVLEDTRADPLLRGGAVAGELAMTAYAGVPLTTPAGHPVGTLCVADGRVRTWTADELELLHELALIAEREIAWSERSAQGVRTEDEIDGERRFIGAVLEHLEEGVVACDGLGELRIVNAAARRLGAGGPVALGELVERGELRRASSGDPVAQEDLPLERALRGESLAGEEYLAGDPAGPRRSIVIAGRPIDAADGAGGAIMTIRDVSEERLAQIASREAEEHFRIAFEHAPVGMGIAGLDGRLRSANVALAELTGLRAEALRRTTLESLLHPEDVDGVALALQALAGDPAGVVRMELRILHADGRQIWASMQFALVRDGAGRPHHLLVQLQDMTEPRREVERLRTLADRDALTLLLNRNGFGRELRRHAARVERYGSEGGVLLIDVDGMRQINASLGRGGGDDVLRAIAEAIEGAVRRSDSTARLGEDEFAVLVPHGSAEGLIALAEALAGRLELAQQHAQDSRRPPVTVSIGVAAFGCGATEADTVLRRATAAKDAAARAGGGRALLFGPAVLSTPAD